MRAVEILWGIYSDTNISSRSSASRWCWIKRFITDTCNLAGATLSYRYENNESVEHLMRYPSAICTNDQPLIALRDFESSKLISRAASLIIILLSLITQRPVMRFVHLSTRGGTPTGLTVVT